MQIMNTHKYQTKLLHVYTYRICISVKIKAEYMQYSTKFLIILADSVLVLWLCQLQQKTSTFLRLCRFLWSLWVDLSHKIIEDLEKKLAVSSIDHTYMYMYTMHIRVAGTRKCTSTCCAKLWLTLFIVHIHPPCANCGSVALRGYLATWKYMYMYSK